MEFDAHQERDEGNKVPHFSTDSPRENHGIGKDSDENASCQVNVEENEVTDNDREVTDSSCNYKPINLRKSNQVQER